MAPETFSGEDPQELQQRISWVLEHPGMSLWLKQALRGGLSRDPVAVLNDLEILNATLREACKFRIKSEFAGISPARRKF